MKKILIFILFLGLNHSLYAEKKNQNKTIDSLTIDMKISEGLINTYTNEENKLYFEISKNLLGKELLVVTRLAQLPGNCLLYTSPSPRDRTRSRMPSSA